MSNEQLLHKIDSINLKSSMYIKIVSKGCCKFILIISEFLIDYVRVHVEIIL